MKRMVQFGVIIALLVVGSVGWAQSPGAAPPVDKTPQLTEVQALKLQVNVLKAQNAQQAFQLLQQQAMQLDQEREAMLAAIEQTTPGWVIDRQTFQFKKVPPPEPMKAPVAPPKK